MSYALPHPLLLIVFIYLNEFLTLRELSQAAETTSGITVRLALVRLALVHGLKVPGVVILRKDVLLVISSATLAEPRSILTATIAKDNCIVITLGIGIDRPGFSIGNDILDRTNSKGVYSCRIRNVSRVDVKNKP